MIRVRERIVVWYLHPDGVGFWHRFLPGHVDQVHCFD